MEMDDPNGTRHELSGKTTLLHSGGLYNIKSLG